MAAIEERPKIMDDNDKRAFTDDEEALAFHRYPTPGKIGVG